MNGMRWGLIHIDVKRFGRIPAPGALEGPVSSITIMAKTDE
jgi:hypothetical protein